MSYQLHSIHRNRGFSLLELMIAVGLGAALLFGVIQIFDSNKQSSRLQHAFVEVQESGRIASELLTREIRMADYWGCLKLTSDINNMLDTSDEDYSDYQYDNASGITADNNVSSAYADVGGVAVKPGTDVLTIKGSKRLNGFAIGKASKSGSATIHVLRGQVSLDKGTVVLLTDCSSGDLFANTQNTKPQNGRLGHNTGNLEPVKNNTKELSRDYEENDGASLYLPFTKSFFIGQNTVAGWSLYSHDVTDDAAQELVRNVEDLQFIYGVDSDDNKSADLYVEAPTAAQMDQTLSIRARITAHSSSDVVSGSPLTRTFSATANIRNRSL